jgi:Fe-S cluster assembly protein SufD
MNIQENYNEFKDKFLFNESKKFNNLRKDIVTNFDLSAKIKKYNESLKHLDPHVLEFSFKYKFFNNKINYSEVNENKINIDVNNGRIINIKRKSDDKDIAFSNIDSLNKNAKYKFLDFQKNFDEDYIVNLNTLMLNSGYQINIAENKKVNIIISNSIDEKDLTVFQKNIINCGKNTSINLIEEYNFNKKSNNNIVSLINLENGANLNHIIFQKNDEKANLQSTSNINCNKNSKYKQIILNISKGSIRNHHYANLRGENSSAYLDGIFFGSGNQVIDNKTQITHSFPNCISSQRYKGILTDQAKASYLSKTYVDEIAQKTEAYQLSKGILLSDKSYFHSKPELRIFADDVKCSHGSTIGPIDSDLLFYLRSRGLSKRISTSLLIKSFFDDIVSESNDKSFIEKFNYHSSIWLNCNNI